MQAAIFCQNAKGSKTYLSIEDVPRPAVLPGHSLLRVIACGECRTDLHIVTGELPALKAQLIPGHQIVGDVVDGATPNLPIGMRVGVFWMGGVDGTCWYCMHSAENLCDEPVFTGYTVDGGYAEFVLVRTDFLLPLPAGLDNAAAAPLLCAGIIGFRSLRVAGVQPGERVGLYGFGSSASLAIQVLCSWDCEVYVSSRGQGNRDRTVALNATWVGKDGNHAARCAGSCDHLCSERGSCDRSAERASQRWRRSGQRNSYGPNSGIRLRQPALGRAANTHRSQHDQGRCPRLP